MNLFYKIQKQKYNVYIKNNIQLTLIKDLKKFQTDKKILFVYDKKININLVNDLIKSLREDGCKLFLLELEAEKFNKNQKSLFKIIDFLINNEFTKRSIILSFGGGVIGDISALAASLYLRGLIYLHIPSTMTSIIDSCIGGKTAINYKNIINSIGNYYHPKSVYISHDVIKRIPHREYLSGIPEIIKCSVIKNIKILKYLEKYKERILNRDFQYLSKIIYETLKVKISLFKDDVFENNKRLFLNFGHTFAHAIEMATQKVFKKEVFRHGEAVGIGMLCEIFYSNKEKKCKKYDKISNILHDMKLPNNLNISNFASKRRLLHNEIYKSVFLDKKKLNKNPRYICLKNYGNTSIREISDYNLLNETISNIFYE